MEKSGTTIIDLLLRLIPDSLHFPYIGTVIGFLLLLTLSAILQFIVRASIIRFLNRLNQMVAHDWYTMLIQHKVPQRGLFILPLSIFYVGFDWVSDLPPELLGFFIRLINAIMFLVIARTISAFLSTINSIYSLKERAKDTPIKSYIQLGKVIVYIVAGLFIISQLANQPPWYFLTGIGAMMAIIILVFRDTLLSLVASIQLTNNDAIRVGDWIEMPQFGADGDVIDMALNAVSVQNWDKTITVIPTHKFLDHSFRNWRGMQESGGRRIMRSLIIDVRSIRFLKLAEIERLRESYLLKDYIEKKLDEVHEYNRKNMINSSAITNARWLTNIGTFRIYAFEYLKHHPNTHKGLLTLVRQLEPTDHGLPLQIYTFTDTIQWAQYEQIQADIFDHLLSILPEFGLRHYQEPSGHDFEAFLRRSVQPD